jgi:hypothetical protein
MKNGAAALALILSGCGTVELVQAPEVSEPECTASCNAHYVQCPKIFANFPERGAVECPAEHGKCLTACASAKRPGRAAPPASGAVGVASTAASKEARLRELKHFHDEGLVTEDVYRERQTAILAEP